MKNERKKFREWNINSSMQVWVELGCPKEKLNIGLSAYGLSFIICNININISYDDLMCF